MATNDALARAIEYLGAVCVRPGEVEHTDDGRRVTTRVIRSALYAFQPCGDAWRVWRVTDERGLLSLMRSEIDALRVGAAMPAWWSPEQRFATVYDDPALDPEPTPYATLAEARSATVRTGIRHAITASLETGEEVPA